MEKTRRLVFVITIFSAFSFWEVGFTQQADSRKEQREKFELSQQKDLKGRSRDWLYTGLEINYIVLNAADLATAFYGLEKGAQEANPVARLFIQGDKMTFGRSLLHPGMTLTFRGGMNIFIPLFCLTKRRVKVKTRIC